MENRLTTFQLMRETVTPFPRRTDGSGVCFLYCKRATRDYFKLDQLPFPEDHGVPDPSGKGRLIYMSTRKGGANNLNLRIAYEWRSRGQKPYMVRLRIGGDPCMDTVQVLTNYLNETGVEWLYICNANGNRLSRSCFHSSDWAFPGVTPELAAA